MRAGIKLLPWEINHTILWRVPGWLEGRGRPSTFQMIGFGWNVQSGNWALVFWVDERSLGSSTLGAIHIDGDGQIDCPLFMVSSTPASKSRLAASVAPSGLAAIAWQDSRNMNSDVFIQNVNPDCSLGSQKDSSQSAWEIWAEGRY